MKLSQEDINGKKVLQKIWDVIKEEKRNGENGPPH